MWRGPHREWDDSRPARWQSLRALRANWWNVYPREQWELNLPAQWPSLRAFRESRVFALRNCVNMARGARFFTINPRIAELDARSVVGCSAKDSRWDSMFAEETAEQARWGRSVDARALADAIDLYEGRGRAGARLLRMRLLGWRRSTMDPRPARPGDVEARCREELALMDRSPLSVTRSERRVAGVPHIVAYLRERGAWPGVRRFCEIWEETHPTEQLAPFGVNAGAECVKAFRDEIATFDLGEGQASCDARLARVIAASPMLREDDYVWRAGELPHLEFF